MFCEEAVLAGARNLRTYGQMAMSASARSCLLLRHPVHPARLATYLVPVSKWKKAVVGTGSASKDDVSLWLNRVYPGYSSQCDGRQDLIDACAIAIYGLSVIADSMRLRSRDDVGETV